MGTFAISSMANPEGTVSAGMVGAAPRGAFDVRLPLQADWAASGDEVGEGEGEVPPCGPGTLDVPFVAPPPQAMSMRARTQPNGNVGRIRTSLVHVDMAALRVARRNSAMRAKAVAKRFGLGHFRTDAVDGAA